MLFRSETDVPTSAPFGSMIAPTPTFVPVATTPSPWKRPPIPTPTVVPIAVNQPGTTCPDGSPAPKFPNECEIDCPRTGPPPVFGCVKFCDVRPILGCLPLCPTTVTALVPGGCRERCCDMNDDNSNDDVEPTSAPLSAIIGSDDTPPSSKPVRQMKLFDIFAGDRNHWDPIGWESRRAMMRRVRYL